MSALTKITIDRLEEAESRNGPYFKVFDDMSNIYSCWDMLWFPELKKYEGQEIDLETLGLTITTKGRYKNITEIDERAKPANKQDKLSARIKEHEEDKSNRIAKAMDRNEKMYAKLGAAQMVAFHPAYKDYKGAEVEKMVEHLTNFILDLQPDGEHTPHITIDGEGIDPNKIQF